MVGKGRILGEWKEMTRIYNIHERRGTSYAVPSFGFFLGGGEW